MKRFIFFLTVFISPFFIAIIGYKLIYTKTGGNLNRLGKIPINIDYGDIFHEEYKQDLRSYNLSELDLNKENHIKFLTFGDSFSNRDNIGYQNYIAILDNSKIVNFEWEYYDNPVQALYQAINSGLFSKIEVDYVILQSVENMFIKRTLNINYDSTFNINELKIVKIINESDSEKNINRMSLLFDDVGKFYLYNLLYNFDDRAYFSDVYKLKLTKELFSSDYSDLLFNYEDIYNMKNINELTVSNLNIELNLLSIKLNAINIKLIVLPSPDKYDLYYDYISENIYPKNYFFDYLRKEKKKYLFIDSKNILAQLLQKGEKDVYFADDTHWSPKASKILAEKIISTINEAEEDTKNLNKK